MNFTELKTVGYSNIDVFEGDDYSFEELFHEYTKLNPENVHHINKRVGQILRDARLQSMLARSWKTYRGHERIPLPAPSLGNATLEDVLRSRCSLSSKHGHFSGAPMTLPQLSGILGLSYGITHSANKEHHFRATPSAGGLYPLEIYALVNNVVNLAAGIYHYRVIDHCLEVVRSGSCWEEFAAANTNFELAEKAPVCLVVTCVFQRNFFKYQNRGYRFVMNDVGAVLQSLYLTATALGLGTCALGGFFDDNMGDVLGINNVDEAAAVCFLVGPEEGTGLHDASGNGSRG